MLAEARQAWSRGGDGSEPAEPIFAEDIISAVSREECLLLARLAEGKRVLEVGSYLGRSTVALASTAAIVHSVDVHPPDDQGLGLQSTVSALVANLTRYGVRDKVLMHVGFSQLILPELQPESFDLIFLDAEHQRAAVEEDLAAILPLAKRPSTLAFHDYGVPGTEHNGRWDPFGVTEVVDEFAAAQGLSVEVVGTVAVVRLPAS